MTILDKLIGFPTVSADTNLACIDYIETFLSEHGFDTSRLYNPDKTKANLLARAGPEVEGGIILSGHTDVVPVEGQHWDTDPFILLEKDGRLHGRGTADMKGFLALTMEAAAAVVPDRLQKPLYLIFTYDEEIGCLGAKSLMDKVKTLDRKPRFVLIGEPTNMDLVTAHKGICLSTTHVRGRSAHASCPGLGASAIVAASRLISCMNDIIPAEWDEKFDPPSATLNIGTIHGGNATNIIAQDCSFEWELRPLPSQQVRSVQDGFSEMVKTLEREMPGIFVEHRVDAVVPGLEEGKNREIAAGLQSLLPHSRLTTAAFTTEAGLFQQAGIPAIVCGPGHVNQAHQPNEYVRVAMMDHYRKFLFNVVDTLTNA